MTEQDDTEKNPFKPLIDRMDMNRHFAMRGSLIALLGTPKSQQKRAARTMRKYAMKERRRGNIINSNHLRFMARNIDGMK